MACGKKKGKRNDSNRYDTIDINKMATKFVKTDEGF